MSRKSSPVRHSSFALQLEELEIRRVLSLSGLSAALAPVAAPVLDAADVPAIAALVQDAVPNVSVQANIEAELLPGTPLELEQTITIGAEMGSEGALIRLELGNETTFISETGEIGGGVSVGGEVILSPDPGNGGSLPGIPPVDPGDILFPDDPGITPASAEPGVPVADGDFPSSDFVSIPGGEPDESAVNDLDSLVLDPAVPAGIFTDADELALLETGGASFMNAGEEGVAELTESGAGWERFIELFRLEGAFLPDYFGNLVPEQAGLAGETAPFGLDGLRQALDDFMAQAEQTVATLLGWLAQLGPLPWILMGLSLALAGYLLARQRQRQLRQPFLVTWLM